MTATEIRTLRKVNNTPESERGMFFPEHVWVTDEPYEKIGKVIPEGSPEEVARAYWRLSMHWWNKGQTFTAYIHTGPNAEPIRVDIDW